MNKNGKLCILCCRNFQQEIAAAIAAEGWDDVSVAAFPAYCGNPPLSWSDLQPLLEENCTLVVILGVACLCRLGDPPPDWPPVRLLHPEQCFHIVTSAALVADAIENGAYLLTPAWLERWPERLAEMGFKPETAAEFFQDSTRELLLLDTGIDPEAASRLNEFAKALNLPSRRIPIGLDHTRLLLARLLMEWRLETLQHTVQIQKDQYARELADHD